MRSVSMQRRLLIATLLVALLAVIVTAVVALGAIRSVDVRSARATLGAQAEAIAAARPAVRLDVVSNLSEVDGQLVAMIPAEGPAVGSAAGLAAPRIVAQVRNGGEVSTLVHEDGRNYLVEARPTRQGGGVLVAQDAATVRALTPTVVARILLALTVGLGAAALAAWLVTRSLARPLGRLATRANRLAAGERGVGVSPVGVAEIDQIDQALASLDAALARSEGRQREFLLSVSHEIRTPLTTIRGYAEAMADGLTSPGEAPEIGRTLQAEVERLTTFTEDLLALARLEADDFSLDVVDGVEVASLLQSAAEAWRAKASAAGVEVVVEADPRAPSIRTDPRRVRQLVDGLIDNALRVSPERGVIVLAVRPGVEGSIQIEVRDRGPGLTAADAAEAFQRGTLHARYQSTRPVGSGLGLSIAARLVERLGGSIEAIPGAEGATFRIGLPAAAA